VSGVDIDRRDCAGARPQGLATLSHRKKTLHCPRSGGRLRYRYKCRPAAPRRPATNDSLPYFGCMKDPFSESHKQGVRPSMHSTRCEDRVTGEPFAALACISEHQAMPALWIKADTAIPSGVRFTPKSAVGPLPAKPLAMRSPSSQKVRAKTPLWQILSS